MATSVNIVPALGTGLVASQTGPSSGYDAIDIRRAWTGFERGEGVSTYESFRVAQRGAGANMSVDVGMDERAYVRGDSVTLQGLYCVTPHASTINVDVSAANGSNPRLDMVVLEVKDDAHDVGGLNVARVKMVDGTASSGATLDNRTGATALPASCLHLADVLVATSDTSITTAEIRDRRPFSAPGVIPPLLTDVDMVVPQCPLPLLSWDSASDLIHTTHDTDQVDALIYIPRRIVSATKIRWKYIQGSTALTGNYVFAISDASGRPIVNTGSVAFTGSAATWQVRSETITATTFEPGWHRLLFGVDTGTGSGGYVGWWPSGSAGGNTVTSTPFPNVLLTGSGGVTVPSTVLGLTDSGPATSPGVFPKVPQIAISVG